MLRLLPTALFLASLTASSQSPTRPAQLLSLQQLWNLDATYSDPAHGVTFRYPSAWKPGADFAYHEPVLAGFVQLIAAFGFDARNSTRPNPYTNTDLEGFGIAYAAAPAQTPQPANPPPKLSLKMSMNQNRSCPSPSTDVPFRFW